MFVKAKDKGRKMPPAEENASADVVLQEGSDGIVRRRRAPMNGGHKCEQERSLSSH